MLMRAATVVQQLCKSCRTFLSFIACFTLLVIAPSRPADIVQNTSTMLQLLLLFSRRPKTRLNQTPSTIIQLDNDRDNNRTHTVTGRQLNRNNDHYDLFSTRGGGSPFPFGVSLFHSAVFVSSDTNGKENPRVETETPEW